MTRVKLQDWITFPNILISFLILLGINGFQLYTGSFPLPKWIGLFSIALFFLWDSYSRLGEGQLKVILDRGDLALMAFIFFVALSILWAPDKYAAMMVAACLLALSCLYWLFKHASLFLVTRLLPATLMVSVVTSVALGLFFPQYLGGYGNENFHTEALLLSLPICFLWYYDNRRIDRFLPGLVAVVALLFLFLWNGGILELAIVPALAVFFILRNGRLYVSAALVLLGIFLLAAGYWGLLATDTLLPESIVQSFRPRAELLLNTLLMWWEKPLLGHGAGSFTYSYGAFREAHLDFVPAFKGTVLDASHFYAEAAHNEYAQFLAETGIIGFVLFGAFVILASSRMVKSGPIQASCPLGVGLCITMILAVLVFPLQNPATAGLLFIMLGICGNRYLHSTDDRTFTWNIASVPMMRSGLTAVFTFIAVGSIYGGYSSILAARAFNVTQNQLETDPETAFSNNLKAVELFWPNRTYRRQLFISFAGMHARDPYSLTTEDEADRYFVISQSAGPWEPILLMTRYQYMANSGRGDYQELNKQLMHLQEVSSLLPMAHLLEADFAIRNGQWDRAASKLEHVKTMGMLHRREREMMAGIRSKLPSEYR